MRTQERTLVTGFGPFLKVTDNPSAKVAEALGRPFEILEVSYNAAETFLATADPGSFDRLLLLGVAGSRSHLTAEIFARNAYGAVPDVAGGVRQGAIDESRPLLLENTLFDPAALSSVLAGDPSIRMSLDAGSYLCNFTYFKAILAFPGKQVGFLHVPPVEKVSLDRQIASARNLLETLEVVPV